MRYSVARGTARCLRACLRCVAIVISGMTARPAPPPDAGCHIWHDTSRVHELSLTVNELTLDAIRSLTRYCQCDS